MAYDVQVGSGGYIGWKLLERTMTRQRALFAKNTAEQASRDYFTKRMPQISSADDFVRDHKLMTVALRAFGLDDHIKSKSFIRKILEANPQDNGSIVNRLNDKRYLKLNQALHSEKNIFGVKFANISAILSDFDARSFERNIGKHHAEIEIALTARRELSKIASSDAGIDTKWYQILSSKPLRKIFEVTLGLGERFSNLPLERQLSDIKKKTARLTGSNDPSQFQSSAAIENIIKKFLLINQIKTTPISYTLLISAGVGAGRRT